MRFDNPIHDHGFVFPDIADFPDVSNEKRYIGDGKVEYVSMMKEAIQKNDLNMFEQSYKWYMKLPDAKLFDKLNKMFKFYSDFKNSRIESDIPSNKIYEDLFEKGISYLNFDTKDLNVYCKSHINELLSKPDWSPPPGQFDRSKQLDDTFKKYIQNMFENYGIIDAVSKYNKGSRRLKVANVVLHIAKPTDQNWKQFLYDCKTVTKTTNLHIDPKEDVIKAMMYLNDITENDGPFSYVEKSNRWIYDDLQNIFGRAISTGSYCHTPESRAVVFQLPKQLRISHNFGRVLLDNTEEQYRILKQEKLFTSDKGNLCIFDPAGMHRGGICKTGNRIALQILMK
jgi:hypothetical protein